MPRRLHPDLELVLDRPNPLVEHGVELSAPDVGKIHRRGQSLLSGAPLVSMTPAAGLAASMTGALQIAATSTPLGAQSVHSAGSFDLSVENPARRLKSMAFVMGPTFQGGIARSFSATVARFPAAHFGLVLSGRFQLQVYRAVGIRGVQRLQNGTERPWTDWTFQPLLSPPKEIQPQNITWTSHVATLFFDLSEYGLQLFPVASTPSSEAALLEPNVYYFVVTVIDPPQTNYFNWRLGAKVTNSAGTFERRWWVRDSDTLPWSLNAYADVPLFSLDVESFAPAGGTVQAVYSVDMGGVPKAASTGRVVVEKFEPSGTSLVIERATASGGPWTVVKNGDSLAGVALQQTLYMRQTWTPSADGRRTPYLFGFGYEYREPYDVTFDAAVTLPSHDINLPLCEAAVGDTRLTVIKPGSRDYDDLATVLGSTRAPTKLEADIFLRSPHPSITRDKWLRLERLSISNEDPTTTAEHFTAMSYGAILQRKFPGKSETINSVHEVVTSNGTMMTVTPVLPGTTLGGNEYDGKGYYVRVRSGTYAGRVMLIAGSTNTGQIDIASAPDVQLTAGDLVEVHSGIYTVQRVTYQNWDPADVWMDILARIAVPDDRIGHPNAGGMFRSGLPPRVTDRAPGDATTQAKLKVSMDFTEEEVAQGVLDELSFIMGGATVEENGQIVFVQIYPLSALDGTPTVPNREAVAIFDGRTSSSNRFPRGLEHRVVFCKCGYGVNRASANPDAVPQKHASAVDNDALNWLAKQDLDRVGVTDIPENISRWIYNSADGGLYLASLLCSILVRALSTGMRVWPYDVTEERPDIVLGDVVIIITDAYTDYDPGTGFEIKGLIAVRTVVVGTGGGRRLRLFVPGLAGNVARITASTAATGGGDTPSPALAPITITGVTTRTHNGLVTPAPVFHVEFTPLVDGRVRHYELEVSVDGGSNYGIVDSGTASPLAYAGDWDVDYRFRIVGVDVGGGRSTGPAFVFNSGHTGGKLAGDIVQEDSAGQRVLSRGAQRGSCKNGDAITFNPPFQNPPRVTLSGGIAYEPRSKFGPLGDGTETGAPNGNEPQWPDYAALNLTASGFTARARIRQKGAAALVQHNFPGDTADAVGETVPNVGGTDAASAPSADESYIVRYDASVKARARMTTYITVAVDSRPNSAGSWTERAARTHSIRNASPFDMATVSWTNQSFPLFIAGLSGGGDPSEFRVRIKSYSYVMEPGYPDPEEDSDMSLVGCVALADIEYSTAADHFASKTPDNVESVTWEADEVSIT